MELKKARKVYSEDLDKARPPKETLAIVREKLGRLGKKLLTKTMRIDSGRLGIPVYISICGEDAVRTIGTQKQMGKGSTPEQAETSALMELIERYSFFSFLQATNFKVASYADINDRALQIESFMLSIHDSTTDVDKALEALNRVPL
ncbi:MAG: hypothetical protein DRG59_11405, partial [Deltaproteobacteria bacterium]